MSKTTKNLLSIGLVLLVLATVYIFKFSFGLTPRLGLDLKGGVSLVYEAQGKKVDAGVLDKTVEKIRTRVDRLGVAEPEITRQGARNVIVQLPGIHDPERAKALVGKTAQLQFRLVQESKPAKEAAKDPAWKETPELERKKDAVVILPYAKGKDKVFYKLGPTLLTGDIIKKAQVAYDENGDPRIDFTTTDAGKKQFGDVTTANVNKQLAIVLDYVVESAPNIESAITEGKGQITGKFTEKEAKDVAIVLNIGALPFELTLISEGNI